MDRQLIVEVLDRRGHVVSRHRVDELPATLGRGYRCAVILDDRFVSPEHARIEVEPDGGLTVIDLDSLNGLRRAGSRNRVPRVAIRPGTRIRLGQTVLRFCYPDQPVAPAVRERGETIALGGLVLAPAHGLAIGAVAAGWVGLLAFLGSFDGDRGTNGTVAVIAMSLVIALWAGIWALLGRLLVHRPRFSLHVGLAGLAVILSIVIEIAGSYAEFLLPQHAAIGPISATLNVLVVGALLAGSLALATALPKATRIAIGFGLSMGLVGLSALAVAAFDSDSERAATFEGAIKGLGQRWVNAATPDRFFDDVERLVTEVDELAAHDSSGAPDSSSANPGTTP